MRILTIGSTVIDLFLQPDIQPQQNNITLNLGAKIPTDFTSTSIGGNAANVAVVLKRLGIDAPLYTYLAKDFFAKEIELGLEKEGIGIIAEKIKGKSDFSLILTVGNERIIFSHHDQAPHSFKFNRVTPDLIYLTSIGKEWTDSYKKATDYAKSNQIPLALSPGSQQLADLNDTFYTTLKHSTYFFANQEESKKITAQKYNSDTTQDIIKNLHALGPKIVSITQGNKGALASDGTQTFQIGVTSEKIVEKTGAGDTYAATFLAYHAKQKDVSTAMRAATLNAGAVMKKVGAHAGMLAKEQLDKELDNNKNLKPSTI